MKLERLESRIAPAIVFTYTEFDGDLVTVTLSKGNVGDAIFTHPPVPGLFGDQLQRINLNGNQVFAGANMTITAKPQLLGDTVRGDGLANVGFIDASGGGGIDLGAVKINGDLCKILAGDATLTTPGVKSLSVLSLGRFGTTTGASDLNSTIKGKLGSVVVRTDVVDAIALADSFGPITVSGSVSGMFDSNGNMGNVRISGDLRGDGSTRGVISADGNIGAITIGGDILGAGLDPGGIVPPTSGGFISCTGDIASVNVGGSILASGDGANGFIICSGDMGRVKIGRDLRGIEFGSGVISAGGKLASVTIGGSVFGIGSEDNNARISSGRDMGPVTIRGSLESLGGNKTAEISSGGKMGAIVVGGNVDGGGANSGFIHTTNGGAIASVTIGGSLIGGAGMNAGKIFTTGAVGRVKIGGDMNGKGGSASNGVIEAHRIASVTIGGSLIGGSQPDSGEIFCRGNLGPVKIGGDILGGTGSFSGYIQGDRIPSVFIGGSIIAEQTIATPTRSASIRAFFDIGSITVRGSLLGNQISGFAESVVIISAQGNPLLATNAAKDVAIGKIYIGGRVEHAQILAGFDIAGVGLAPANADAQIGSVTVKGDWLASSLIAGVMAGGDGLFGTSDDTKMSGAGVKDTSDTLGAVSKIAKVIINGHALGTLSSSDSALFGIEAQKIGSIKLGGAFAPLHLGASNDLFGDRLVLGPTRTPSGTGFDFHAFEV